MQSPITAYCFNGEINITNILPFISIYLLFIYIFNSILKQLQLNSKKYNAFNIFLGKTRIKTLTDWYNIDEIMQYHWNKRTNSRRIERREKSVFRLAAQAVFFKWRFFYFIFTSCPVNVIRTFLMPSLTKIWKQKLPELIEPFSSFTLCNAFGDTFSFI